MPLFTLLAQATLSAMGGRLAHSLIAWLGRSMAGQDVRAKLQDLFDQIDKALYLATRREVGSNEYVDRVAYIAAAAAQVLDRPATQTELLAIDLLYSPFVRATKFFTLPEDRA